MQSQNVSFENDQGEALAGLLDMPAGRPIATALFAHCFTCSKNLRAAAHISRAMTDAGIAVMRFDFTGLGQSEGDFADTSFSSNVEDLVSAASYLERQHSAPSIMLGHSLGGTAAILAAASLPSVAAVATIGAPADPNHVRHMFADSEVEIETSGEAEVNLGGRTFRVRKQFLDDLLSHQLTDTVAGFRKALLVMHAPLDDVVDIDNAAALFAAAKHPKSFVSLDKADHLLSEADDSRYAGGVVAAWALRYLPTVERPEPLAGSATDVVARTFAGAFRTDVVAAGHPLTADEPLSVGGTNEGPSPYDLLSAALASCTSMTLKVYADFKKLDLRSATVRVRHGRIHGNDCVDCETKDDKVDEFQRELILDGDLTDAERQRLLAIADRCPVHKSLISETKIRTALA